VQVYWTRKYRCHHHYDPVTKKHWRCDLISNKEHDRHWSAGDLRERRAMKRAVRQAGRQLIREALFGIERWPARPGKRHSYQERREMDRQRALERWRNRSDYPFPYSRPHDWRQVEDEKFHTRWALESEHRRLAREVERLERRLESHPWEAALLPELRQKLQEAERPLYRYRWPYR
jgi:hypothetical protein